jgi:hypothetical protein
MKIATGKIFSQNCSFLSEKNFKNNFFNRYVWIKILKKKQTKNKILFIYLNINNILISENSKVTFNLKE